LPDLLLHGDSAFIMINPKHKPMEVKTMANNNNLKAFSKDDPRINRSGRPRNYDVVHQLAKELMYEPVDIRSDGKAMSRLESILREWFTSDDFRKQLAVIQYAFGKVPNKETVQQDTNAHITMNWDGVYKMRDIDENVEDELDEGYSL